MAQRLVVPEMVTVPICICRLYIYTHMCVCMCMFYVYAHMCTVCICLCIPPWWCGGGMTRDTGPYIYIYIHIYVYIYIYVYVKLCKYSCSPLVCGMFLPKRRSVFFGARRWEILRQEPTLTGWELGNSIPNALELPWIPWIYLGKWCDVISGYGFISHDITGKNPKMLGDFPKKHGFITGKISGIWCKTVKSCFFLENRWMMTWI